MCTMSNAAWAALRKGVGAGCGTTTAKSHVKLDEEGAVRRSWAQEAVAHPTICSTQSFQRRLLHAQGRDATILHEEDRQPILASRR